MEAGFPSLLTSPVEFEDASGRAIRIEPPGDPSTEPLVEMYLDLDGRCRAMGIPPTTESELETWLSGLADGRNLVAKTDDRVVGHAVLLSDEEGSHELAIFVHQEFQNAGIGTELTRALLGDARTDGIDHVWLTVACGNAAAKRLFRTLGFSVADRSRRQLRMERHLRDPGNGG